MLPPKTLLIPGPWNVRGNTVLDANGKTIAVCFARNATAHAYWIAELPNLVDLVSDGGSALDDRDVEELRARISRLEGDLDASEETRRDFEIEIADLKAENDRLSEELESLKNKGLGRK